jgi:Co/Zn/Cd efflux system component
MVCGVVVALFLDYFTDLPLDPVVAVLFIAAMLLLSSALYCLLREVTLINRGTPEDC